MTAQTDNSIISDYRSFLDNPGFVCIAGKAALKNERVRCLVADDMARNTNSPVELSFLYSFIDNYRSSSELYHSAALIFRNPSSPAVHTFETLLWNKLEALRWLDRQNYTHDDRVSADPANKNYSFSLKGEAMFVIGLHPCSSRVARRFKYPALVFNPHQQFEALRKNGKYDMMKYVVRKKDVALSGNINPMLEDFGKSSEVFQYSGCHYDVNAKCPFKKYHG